MDKVKVSNMTSSRGNTIANQFNINIVDKDGATFEYFQSYDSIIAVKAYRTGMPITLDEYYWNYSRTTGKYRNIFLNESKKETQAKIDSGVYKLANLN